jgi:hypothetical protein
VHSAGAWQPIWRIAKGSCASNTCLWLPNFATQPAPQDIESTFGGYLIGRLQHPILRADIPSAEQKSQFPEFKLIEFQF